VEDRKVKREFMEYLVTAEEMRRYDDYTIRHIGIPAMVLMERAALAALQEIERHCGAVSKMKVLVFAGHGNNGADALALARLLAAKGAAVDVVFRDDVTNSNKEWLAQKTILEYYPVGTGRNPQPREYTILIDGIFGSGLNREISGVYGDYIQYFNQSQGFKVALDMPSGIHTDSGKVMGIAAKCDLTVTFAFPKRGLCLPPGSVYAGEVVCRDIGIGAEDFAGSPPVMFRYMEEPYLLMPPRDRGGNKGTFGKVLLAAGSYKMAGAAVLAGRSAYRVGVGMVKLLSCEENREILQTTVPEALFGTWEDLDSSVLWADCIAAGPGLGNTQEGETIVRKLIMDCDQPLLLDADALNILASSEELSRSLAARGAEGRPIILTPHMGELSRLLQVPVEELKENQVAYARQLAQLYHCTVVAKDAVTVICRESGSICLHTAGNSGMATAGSGDVLTGILAGLWHRLQDPFETAARGVYLHGKAGDIAARMLGEDGMMAGDIANCLVYLGKKLQKHDV
jgi:NAD(P)H-hydrate epimerase